MSDHACAGCNISNFPHADDCPQAALNACKACGCICVRCESGRHCAGSACDIKRRAATPINRFGNTVTSTMPEHDPTLETDSSGSADHHGTPAITFNSREERDRAAQLLMCARGWCDGSEVRDDVLSRARKYVDAWRAALKGDANG